MATNDDNSTSGEAPAPATVKAAKERVEQHLVDGIASYTHGSRTVSRLSPTQHLDALARVEAAARRRRRFPVCLVSQG